MEAFCIFWTGSGLSDHTDPSKAHLSLLSQGTDDNTSSKDGLYRVFHENGGPAANFSRCAHGTACHRDAGAVFVHIQRSCVCQDLRTEPWPCSLLGVVIAYTMRTFAARYMQPSYNARGRRVPLHIFHLLGVTVLCRSKSVHYWKRRSVFGSPCTPLLLLPVRFPKDSKECPVLLNSVSILILRSPSAAPRVHTI